MKQTNVPQKRLVISANVYFTVHLLIHTFGIVCYFCGIAEALQGRRDNVTELGDRRNYDVAVRLDVTSSLPGASMLALTSNDYGLQRRYGLYDTVQW